ncbi:MAG: O-antigen ligase family protein [Bacilli bacterium]|nr:O-antigen ligase family protein [Bacilli bacterium]
MQKNNNLLLPIYLILNILTTLVCSYLVIDKTINLYKLSRLYIVMLVINIIILVIMLIKNIIQKKKTSYKSSDLFLLFIVIFSLISACFAINTKVAFFGFKGRYEGFFQIMYYFSLFLLASLTDKQYRKYIVYAIIFSGFIECIYAILQIKGWLPVHIQYRNGNPWANGFTINPNFFGTLMLLCLSYVIGLFIDSDDVNTKIVFGLLIAVFMIGLLISNTLSVLVGLSIVYIYVLIYSIKNKKYFNFTILTAILAIISITLYATGDTYLFKSVAKTNNQTVDIIKGNAQDNYGTNRIFIWRNTLKIVPENLLHGVGIDNFYYAFGKKPLTMNKWVFDKAHNEYLQILICEGVFSLIAYLIFFGVITIKGIKKSYENKEIYLILPIIGYLVQAFFNISVLEVAPFFYIALGLCINREKTNK